jgi:hypothetical protein
MKVNQLTIVSHTSIKQSTSFSVFSKLSGWLTRLLGCWHTDMSCPITIQGQTYRTCLDCGAQKQFDLESWKMRGDFYYRRPAIGQLRPLTAARLSTANTRPHNRRAA